MSNRGTAAPALEENPPTTRRERTTTADRPDGDAPGDPIWERLRAEAEKAEREEPDLSGLFHACVLDRCGLEDALGMRISRKLGNHAVPADKLRAVFAEAFAGDPSIGERVRRDLLAVVDRDPACESVLHPLLYFKGFQALTAYRVSHFLWTRGRHQFASYLQSLISEEFAVDIHAAARIGGGILLDHATSIVVGETAVIDDDVSLLHEVTLGGTGKEHGDRHPKVRTGVLIGAGAKVLGNVVIGEGAKIAAGSVVLKDVPPRTTVAGVPAKVVCKTRADCPAREMDQNL